MLSLYKKYYTSELHIFNLYSSIPALPTHRLGFIAFVQCFLGVWHVNTNRHAKKTPFSRITSLVFKQYIERSRKQIDICVCVRVFLCVCFCYSLWSGGSRAGLVIVNHHPPWRNSELIETDLWVRLRPLTHHTHPSPCSRGTVTMTWQWKILSDLSGIQTYVFAGWQAKVLTTDPRELCVCVCVCVCVSVCVGAGCLPYIISFSFVFVPQEFLLQLDIMIGMLEVN